MSKYSVHKKWMWLSLALSFIMAIVFIIAGSIFFTIFWLLAIVLGPD